MGTELKLSGYDAIIVRGKAACPAYLWIDDGKVEFRDARHVWGRTTGETQGAIRAQLGKTSHDARVLSIGAAGERLVRFALLVNELRYFNGRAGMGAVMGSKNLKAVAVRGTKKPDLADPAAVTALVEWEEGVAVGAVSALRDDDLITSTHRGHGHCHAGRA